MPAPMNKKAKRLVASHSAPHIIEYTMGRGSNTVKFNLAIVKDEEGKKRAFSRVEEALSDALVGYSAGPPRRPPTPEEDPHVLLDDLEAKLRRTIKTRLGKLESNWWTARIPKDVREKAEERSEKDGSRHEPIEYVDFADYVKILTRRDNPGMSQQRRELQMQTKAIVLRAVRLNHRFMEGNAGRPSF